MQATKVVEVIGVPRLIYKIELFRFEDGFIWS